MFSQIRGSIAMCSAYDRNTGRGKGTIVKSQPAFAIIPSFIAALWKIIENSLKLQLIRFRRLKLQSLSALAPPPDSVSTHKLFRFLPPNSEITVLSCFLRRICFSVLIFRVGQCCTSEFVFCFSVVGCIDGERRS
ncbi:hypothetical protein SDJN02_05731, partial [Cucurbita argyrosperma subsp. argyrosperma]